MLTISLESQKLIKLIKSFIYNAKFKNE